MTMLKKKTRPTNKIAQQIYLKHAGIASQIYAKYADSGSVPTNLISGGGIKPLANQHQQQAQQPTQPEPPKAPETPQQPTQPAAKPIEPIPANVAPPPVVPAPQSGLPPATPMAPAANPAAAPAPNTINSNGQITGERAEPMRISTHIENAQNSGDSAQTHIAPTPDVHADAHPGITTPEAVNPPVQPGQPAGQTGGQSAGQTAGQTPPNTGNQAQNAGQTGGQPSGQSSGQPSGQPQPVDPGQFAQDLQKMPREQAIPKAKEYVQTELAKPENKQVMAGLDDLKSGDPARANSPAAQAYKAAMQKAPEGMIREEYERLMAAHPTATPQEQGGFMRQAIDNGMARFNEMPFPAQLMMGLGLGAGLIGIFSSLFGEGGAESGLMGLLGVGAVGLIGANYGMFGNDARQMVGQGALGLGRMMGMKIPDASAFTPEGMAKAKTEGMAAVQAAIIGDKKKKIEGRGWQGGISKIEELRAPLDQLASAADNYGKDTAITMMMGAMGINDPAAAQAKFDELMQQRQQMMDPQYLRNQFLGDQGDKADDGALTRRLMFRGLEAAYGKYPGAAPAQAAPPQ